MRRFIVAAAIAAIIAPFAGAGTVAALGDSAHVASTVPLLVITARDGEVVALAKVVIHGRAFPFVIDTGASRTLVDLSLARQLHLRTVGKPTKVSGVGCTSASRNVRLARWRVGGQPLPAIIATSTKVSFAGGRAIGLLGSDVLARFGAARLDYRHAELTLG
jgi:predicted aspartyl protease